MPNTPRPVALNAARRVVDESPQARRDVTMVQATRRQTTRGR